MEFTVVIRVLIVIHVTKNDQLTVHEEWTYRESEMYCIYSSLTEQVAVTNLSWNKVILAFFVLAWLVEHNQFLFWCNNLFSFSASEFGVFRKYSIIDSDLDDLLCTDREYTFVLKLIMIILNIYWVTRSCNRKIMWFVFQIMMTEIIFGLHYNILRFHSRKHSNNSSG